ncbi:hypothetical protein K502DRAFT_351596 [Neoconidiobolus thromboides FSU 785]|nr:hypothetical protein K502DRAFT_351596 [Neoconidiobolus thromboides FSU 785]
MNPSERRELENQLPMQYKILLETLRDFNKKNLAENRPDIRGLTGEVEEPFTLLDDTYNLPEDFYLKDSFGVMKSEPRHITLRKASLKEINLFTKFSNKKSKREFQIDDLAGEYSYDESYSHLFFDDVNPKDENYTRNLHLSKGQDKFEVINQNFIKCEISFISYFNRLAKFVNLTELTEEKKLVKEIRDTYYKRVENFNTINQVIKTAKQRYEGIQKEVEEVVNINEESKKLEQEIKSITLDIYDIEKQEEFFDQEIPIVEEQVLQLLERYKDIDIPIEELIIDQDYIRYYEVKQKLELEYQQLEDMERKKKDIQELSNQMPDGYRWHCFPSDPNMKGVCDVYNCIFFEEEKEISFEKKSRTHQQKLKERWGYLMDQIEDFIQFIDQFDEVNHELSYKKFEKQFLQKIGLESDFNNNIRKYHGKLMAEALKALFNNNNNNNNSNNNKNNDNVTLDTLEDQITKVYNASGVEVEHILNELKKIGVITIDRKTRVVKLTKQYE